MTPNFITTLQEIRERMLQDGEALGEIERQLRDAGFQATPFYLKGARDHLTASLSGVVNAIAQEEANIKAEAKGPVSEALERMGP